MSKGTEDLLGFNDFENFGESPEISVNSPKKVTFNDGEQEMNFHCLRNLTRRFMF